MPRQIVLAVTGASGAAYARRMLQVLVGADCAVHLVISPHGRRLFADELDLASPTPETLAGPESADRVTVYPYNDLGARIASGSFLTDGMIVCPCSSNTLGAVAAGTSDNLVARAAQVTLKEARRLVLVHREVPLSLIDIENMARVARAGAIVCPASPPFYLRPRTIDDLVDAVVGKALDLLGVGHDLNTRYKP